MRPSYLAQPSPRRLTAIVGPGYACEIHQLRRRNG